MSARRGHELRRAFLPRLLPGSTVAAWLLLSACSAGSGPGAIEPAPPPAADAPVVALPPGAWFDAQGGLTVVGPGRRLRLALTAPIAACAPGFASGATAAERAQRASLPYHVLSEACRDAYPSILLPEESRTASPAELERSYHEVSRCLASELGATTGWIPNVVAGADPCAAALGQGFRLPREVELRGLTIDDRKAIAGALFDTEDHAAFGSLLLYATDARGQLTLVTLSPNAAEQAPTLTTSQRARPFFGAAVRCVPQATTSTELARLTPRLPHAAACLRALREERARLAMRPATRSTPELGKLQTWVEQASRTPSLLQSDAGLRELGQLLAAPELERLARDARDERALTEHYAELAEGLDDPSVPAGERDRRRAEFDSLRRRLGGQIVQSAEAGGAHMQLSALIAHLRDLLEARAAQRKPERPGRPAPAPDYAPLLERLRALSGEKALAP